MSKEYLESLEKIKKEFNCDPEYYGLGVDFEILESALHRLEAIDNANPSEALYELNRIDCNITYLLSDCDINEEVSMCLNSLRDNKSCEVIKQALIKSQEDKRFIELILNKPQLLNVFALDGVHTWEEFEDTFSDEDKEYINTTKEEYEYMRNQLIKRGKIDE